MKLEEHNLVDAIVITLVLFIVLLLFMGCGTINLMNIDYYPEGNVKRETRVSYYRWFNQSLEGIEIGTKLFTAKLDEQEADNTEVVEAVGSATGNIVGAIVKP